MATWTKTSTNGYYTAQLELTQQSQNVANNTSTVKWIITLLSNSGYFSQIRLGYSLAMGGTTISSRSYSSDPEQHNMSSHSSLQIASGTTTVSHNADGTKSFATGTITFSISSAGVMPGGGESSISGSNTSAFTLSTITQASTVSSSASSNLMGQTRTITITRQSNSFTHVLKYTFGSKSGTIASGVGTSYSWTVPTTLASEVPSGSIRSSGTIICETYSGGSKIGESTCTFLAQIPPSTATTTASDNTMGKSRSFTITRASANLTHTLTYVFGSGSGTITTKTSSTSVSWTVPTSLAQYVAANNDSRTGTVTITTFNGSAEVGTSTVSFTAKIPASTMTKSNATMGIATSFTITRAGTNLTHKITYSFGGTSGTAVNTSDGTSLSWTPPFSLAGQLDIVGGTKSGTITYTLTTYNGTQSCGTKTYTATLNAPSASLTVPSSMTMGTAASFAITDQSDNFAHTITGTFAGTSTTFSTKTTAASVSATFATATFGPLIPTTKSGTATIKQTVYSSTSSNTVVAHNEYTLTLSVPSTKPTATITPSVVTSLANPFNSVYVQNNSQVKVSVTLSSPTGAYLDKASMTIDGVTKNYSVSSNVTSWTGNVTSNLLQTSGTRTIKVTVSDKRGYSGSYTTTISVAAYANPQIAAASGETKVIIERSDSGGTADPAGAYLHLKFTRKISAITNNEGYVSYKIGSGTATTISTSSTASETISQTINASLSEHNSYKVTVRVWDKVGYEVTRTVTIPSLNVTLDLRQGGLGVGVGMFSQGDNRFDVAWDSYFLGSLYLPRIISSLSATNGGYTLIQPVPRWSYDDILSGTDSFPSSNYLTAWLKKVAETYPTAGQTTFVGNVLPINVGFVACYVQSCSDVSGGLPQTATGIYIPYNTATSIHRGAIVRFGTDAYTFWYNVIEASDSEAVTLTYKDDQSIITSANFASGFHCYRSGKVVTLNVGATFSATAGGSGYVTVGTIPSGYRPQNTLYETVPLDTSSYNNCGIQVDTSGNIKIYKNNTSTQGFRVNLTWILA